jgi:hypothetical protein
MGRRFSTEPEIVADCFIKDNFVLGRHSKLNKDSSTPRKRTCEIVAPILTISGPTVSAPHSPKGIEPPSGQ